MPFLPELPPPTLHSLTSPDSMGPTIGHLTAIPSTAPYPMGDPGGHAARAQLPVFFFRLLLKKTEVCPHRAALVIFPEPCALFIRGIRYKPVIWGVQ